MNKIKYFVLLHIIIFLYALSSVCSKYASGEPFLSLKWILLYGLLILLLGIYAILWQQILKKLPLNVAYANKAITILWGMIFGVILFDEAKNITVFNIIGAVIVFVGVVLMVTGEKKNTDEKQHKSSGEKGGDADE